MSIKSNQCLIIVVLSFLANTVYSTPYTEPPIIDGFENNSQSTFEELYIQKTNELINFKIINSTIDKDMCLSSQKSMPKLGSKVTFKVCGNEEKQLWTLNDQDKIVHQLSNKCLATLGNSSILTLWSCQARRSLHRGRVNFVVFPGSPHMNASQTPCRELIAVSYNSHTMDFKCDQTVINNDWLVRTTIDND